jgi:hypothetical protein
MHWREEKCMQSCGRKAEGRGQLKRPRPIWENNIKIDLNEISLETIDWAHFTRVRDQ